jgi:site-specific DNA recombinase
MKIKEIENLGAVRHVLRVALYIRVSSQEQVEGYSIGEQTERLTKYAEAMGWEVYKVYVDPGYSGGNMDRPGLDELIKDVKKGDIDTVVVYKLDRLSRSQFDTLYLIEKVFLAHNTDFVSMTENFSTNTPLGRAMIGFLAVFAQLEKDKINERTLMGKEARAKEGKWHGSKFVPIGYSYDPSDELLHIIDYEALQIREAYDLFLKGTPLRTIETIFLEKGYTHKYGTWDAKRLRYALQNKTYIGYLKYKDNWYKADHKSIIDAETFYKAHKLLNNRAEQYKQSGVKPGAQTTYLGGLLYCKHCGGKYAKSTGGSKKYGEKFYYNCYSRSKKVKKMIKDPNCKNKNWTMESLDKIVLDEIRNLSADPAYIHDIRREKIKENESENKVEILNQEIENIDNQISRFMDLYGIGKFTIEQVSNKIDPLNEQKKKLEKELDSLNADSGELTEEETIEIVKSFGDVLERGNFDEIRLVIESLIYYIELDNDDVYIHWKFI